MKGFEYFLNALCIQAHTPKHKQNQLGQEWTDNRHKVDKVSWSQSYITSMPVLYLPASAHQLIKRIKVLLVITTILGHINDKVYQLII